MTDNLKELALAAKNYAHGFAHPDNGKAEKIAFAFGWWKTLEANRAAAPAAQKVEPDYCTDPDNCRRCKTHPNHRGDMEHAGIGRRPVAAPAAQKENT